MLQFLTEMNPYLWIPVILVAVLITIVVCSWFAEWRKGIRERKRADDEKLYEAIEAAGYSYEPVQDIFYSIMDPWQRKMGYCRLYDEASAPLNMIIDCEPIYFNYDGKKWLIELWKGQYGMTSGGEIGVYTTTGPDLNIPGFFNGTFYECASNEDMLHMSYHLVKNGKLLIERNAKHWWLTGFKLGEFSEPSELVMYLTITLKDTDMRNAFAEGLKRAGYQDREIYVQGNKVGLVFDKPRSPQPVSRIPETDWLIQRKNQFLCEKYMEITMPYESFPDKMNALRNKAPELYEAVLSIGKNRPLFELYEKLRRYLS